MAVTVTVAASVTESVAVTVAVTVTVAETAAVACGSTLRWMRWLCVSASLR